MKSNKRRIQKARSWVKWAESGNESMTCFPLSGWNVITGKLLQTFLNFFCHNMSHVTLSSNKNIFDPKMSQDSMVMELLYKWFGVTCFNQQSWGYCFCCRFFWSSQDFLIWWHKNIIFKWAMAKKTIFWTSRLASHFFVNLAFWTRNYANWYLDLVKKRIHVEKRSLNKIYVFKFELHREATSWNGHSPLQEST